MPNVNVKQQIDAVPSPALRQLDASSQEKIRELAKPVAPAHSLRRTGLRPYAFTGTTVATICGVTPALPFWYELNVHRTANDTYVSDIRLFNNGADAADIFRVEEHGSLEALCLYFESYDTSGDLGLAGETDVPTSNAELALYAARIQLRINRIGDHYRGLVGELLNAVQTEAD